MVVGVLRLEVTLYGIASLKDKRSQVKRVLARCRNRFPVSAAEVGLHDSHDATLLGVVVVGSAQSHLEPLLERLQEEILRTGEVDISGSDIEWLHYA